MTKNPNAQPTIRERTLSMLDQLEAGRIGNIVYGDIALSVGSEAAEQALRGTATTYVAVQWAPGTPGGNFEMLRLGPSPRKDGLVEKKALGDLILGATIDRDAQMRTEQAVEIMRTEYDEINGGDNFGARARDCRALGDPFGLIRITRTTTGNRAMRLWHPFSLRPQPVLELMQQSAQRLADSDTA